MLKCQTTVLFDKRSGFAFAAVCFCGERGMATQVSRVGAHTQNHTETRSLLIRSPPRKCRANRTRTLHKTDSISAHSVLEVWRDGWVEGWRCRSGIQWDTQFNTFPRHAPHPRAATIPQPKFRLLKE